MDKSSIIVGKTYTQVAGGQHTQQIIKVVEITANSVAYEPVSRGYSRVHRQRVSIDRFCKMFKRTSLM